MQGSSPARRSTRCLRWIWVTSARAVAVPGESWESRPRGRNTPTLRLPIAVKSWRRLLTWEIARDATEGRWCAWGAWAEGPGSC